MTSKFKIIISSDTTYNELCAEIFFEDEFVAIITQEEGIENLNIEIWPPKNEKFWAFSFSEFEAIILSAKETLWKMRKSA